MEHTATIEALLVEFGVGNEFKTLADADSFTILTFVFELEKRTGVVVPPTELVPANFTSVQSILEILARAVAAPPPVGGPGQM